MQSSDFDTAYQVALRYLSQPTALLLIFMLCASIAVTALVKLWLGLRGNHPASDANAASFRAPGRLADVNQSIAGEAASTHYTSSDLGYSQVGRNKCKWNRDAIQPMAGATRWICAACQGFSFTSDDRPPVTCRAYEPKQKMQASAPVQSARVSGRARAAENRPSPVLASDMLPDGDHSSGRNRRAAVAWRIASVSSDTNGRKTISTAVVVAPRGKAPKAAARSLPARTASPARR